MPRVCPEKEDVWKKGGNVQKTLQCVQDLISTFASKHLFGIQLQTLKNGGQVTPEKQGKKRGAWEPKQITAPQFKQMLTEFFTPWPSVSKQKGDKVEYSASGSPGKTVIKGAEQEWDIDRIIQNMGDVSEDCREAFAAACHFLLDCATFPVYLSEDETEHLYAALLQVPGTVYWGEGWVVLILYSWILSNLQTKES